METKICLITGATAGIGKASALALAKKGFNLILLCRNEKKAGLVSREIKRKSGNDDIRHYVCDLSLLRDVQRISDSIKKDFGRLDVLINNAGARFLRHQLTKEGIELTLATNHLGHFLLTLSLLDVLKNAPLPRIINVSSGAHYGGEGIIRNIILAEDYDGRIQYSNSKLANVLFTHALDDKLGGSGIIVNSVDPGGVASNFARNNGWLPWLKHRIYYIRKRKLLSPAKGAETLVFLASSDDAPVITGNYYYEMKEKKSSPMSYNKELSSKLWEQSLDLSGIYRKKF